MRHKKPNATDIKEQDLKVILKLSIQLNSMSKAITNLKKEGVLKDYHNSTYEYRVTLLKDYKDWVHLKKIRRLNKSKLALIMSKRKYTMQKIANVLNTNKANAYYMVNPEKRNQNLKLIKEGKTEITKRSALKLVDDWNEYNIENRFPTDETIKAFEYLNLTPPARL